MQQLLRRYGIVGAALMGAGLITAAPGAAPLPVLHRSPEFALTAAAMPAGGLDFLIDPWQTVFHNAQTDIAGLLAAAPITTDQFIDGLTHPQGAADLFQGLTFLDGDEPYQFFRNSLAHWTMDGHATDSQVDGHIPLYLVLTGQLDHEPYNIPAPAEPVPTLANLTASPLSGVLIGAVSPFIAPFVALLNTVEAAFGELTTNPLGALEELTAIPANMLGGLLSGATLNLDFLAPLVSGLLPIPAGGGLDGLSFAFGGLLTPGDTLNNVGGSILNSLGMDIKGLPIVSGGELDVPGNGIGPIGALLGLQEAIGLILADGRDIPELADTVPAVASSAADLDTGGLDFGDLTGWLGGLGL